MDTLLPALEFTSMVTSNASGAVYFAKQKSLDRQVAVKIFSPQLGNEPEFRESFESSARAMGRLRHPNLIGIFDSGRVEEMPYSMMELVFGKPLARSMRGSRIVLEQSLNLINGICEGLACAHDNELIHGHLDPSNILLNQQAEPKLGNFGLSSGVHTSDATADSGHFRAPELSSDQGKPTKASDVFSLGAIFYELITGKAYGPDALPASSISDCGPAIDLVLKRATDPDPARRTPDVRTFRSTLNEAVPGKGLTPALAGKTPAADNSTSSPPAAKPDADAAPINKKKKPVIKTGFDFSFPLKLAIIVALLFAINFTWNYLQKAQADRESENREILAQAEAEKQAAKAAARENMERNLARAAEKSKVETPIPEVPEVPEVSELVKIEETPEQSLSRLQSKLASGGRLEMPVGSVKKGGSDYLLVSQPMTWARAAQFAEEHGAQLASPETDLTWLHGGLTQGRNVWLGAARSGVASWISADGKPWVPATEPAGSGRYLILTEAGTYLSAPAETRLPFVIQWHGDGSNPGTLGSLLAKTRSSLGDADPLFPPGTIASGARHFLHVPRPVTWREAIELAESGGGQLMVVSDPDELADLEKMTKDLDQEESLWLGGSLEGKQWTWITGEPWKAARWLSESRAAEPGAALIIRPGKSWDCQDRQETAAGFIIEWSDDANSPPDPETTSPVAADSLTELNTRAKDLILAADKKRSDDLAANMDKFNWDIDAYLRGLARGPREQLAPHVTELKLCVDENRLKTEQIGPKGIQVTPEMAKLIVYHTEKQTEFDTQFAESARKIRDFLAARLTEIQKDARDAGQVKIADEARKSLNETVDLDGWLRSFDLEIPRAE